MLQKIWLVWVLLLWAVVAQAQTSTVQGSLQDASTQKPLSKAKVKLGDQTVTTDEQGNFKFENVPFGAHVFQVQDSDDPENNEDFTSDPRTLQINAAEFNLGALLVSPSNAGGVSPEDVIPTTSNEENDLSSGGQNISGVLAASRDVYVSTTAFVFGPMRFRLRGYDQDNMVVYMNGAPMNDAETGNPVWNLFGGLNDVMRGREISYGLQPLGFSYGSLAGGTSIDARAGSQRKQIRASYSLSNRMYNHRLMLTYNTGMLKNGWAFSASASRRWAQEGYIDGAGYDSWAYYVGAEKRIGKHSLSLSVIGTPMYRGTNTPTFQELYDLSGTNFYNPQWGYQNGEKRNARVVRTHQPLAVLNHEWTMSEKANLTTSISLQGGRNGTTALDWYDAADPRPDYYRRLPSYYYNTGDSATGNMLTDYYTANPAALQIQWDNLYNVNRNSASTVTDANGQVGNTVTGNRARYILSERRMDNKKFYFNTVYENSLTDRLQIHSGLSYQYETTRNYQLVHDLLGADYFVDVDRFAERDSGVGTDFSQNNLDRKNGILKTGDVYGYDFSSQVHVAKAWGQAQYTANRFDFFGAVELAYNTFWRVGNMRNGKFPNNSLGESEKAKFFNYSVKGGATYKIDGRNYLFANGSIMTRAPFFRDAFIAPRVRDQIITDLQNEQIYSAEGGYLLKSPKLSARAVGYFTQFKNQYNHRTFFLDNAITTQAGDATGGQVNYVMKGIDKQHAGLELAIDAKLFTGFSVKGVAAIGQYIYTNRPQVAIYLDNNPTALVADRTVYLKNYNLSGTPQQAYNVGLNYSGKQFYFLTLNFNYFRNNWIDVNPDRRTLEALSYITSPQYQENFVAPSSSLGQQILAQQKSKDAFTIDFFGGKSFKIKKYFLYVNIGVSNILNNRNIMTWGFEQLRFDYENKNVNKFPTRLSYNFGTNYFINLSLRI
jgi:hypothetical protein